MIATPTRIKDHVGSGAELYAAPSNGEEMRIALLHKRNLVHLGGLFPDETRSSTASAPQDLTVPPTLAKLLIEAGETAAPKVKGA